MRKHLNLCGTLFAVGSAIFMSQMGGKSTPVLLLRKTISLVKTYMTRVEGENTRLRHYLARLHRKTLCYSKSVDMLKYSVRLLLYYLKYREIPVFT